MGGVIKWFCTIKSSPHSALWGGRFVPLRVQWAREKGGAGGGLDSGPLFCSWEFLFFVWLAYSAYSGMEALPENKATIGRWNG